MKNSFSRYFSSALGLGLVCLVAISVAAASPAVLDKDNPAVQRAMAAQRRHTPELMRQPEVVGTATGLTEDGRPAILVLTKTVPAHGTIPANLDGIPVAVSVTGKFAIMKASAATSGSAIAKGKDKSGGIDPTSIFPRPVPIGVSTGNAGECSAGTIGARVKRDGKVYALSNNHVYALENHAPLGSAVHQPGLYDTHCVPSENNKIGTLSEFEPISYTADNIIDAAIALSSTDQLGNATPDNGYGTPGSTTTTAVLNQAVQKYGRTSSLTKGTVSGINGIVNVTYSGGTARFVNQIFVSSRRAFIKAGDSGSLLVTDDAERNPVGLLFAGNGSGKFAIANQIDEVLTKFGVTIDGQ